MASFESYSRGHTFLGMSNVYVFHTVYTQHTAHGLGTTQYYMSWVSGIYGNSGGDHGPYLEWVGNEYAVLPPVKLVHLMVTNFSTVIF